MGDFKSGRGNLAIPTAPNLTRNAVSVALPTPSWPNIPMMSSIFSPSLNRFVSLQLAFVPHLEFWVVKIIKKSHFLLLRIHSANNLLDCHHHLHWKTHRIACKCGHLLNSINFYEKNNFKIFFEKVSNFYICISKSISSLGANRILKLFKSQKILTNSVLNH